MLTLLLAAAALAGPPAPQYTPPVPPTVERFADRPLTRWEIALPGIMTMAPAVVTEIGLRTNPKAQEANYLMDRLGTGGRLAARGFAALAISYAAQRSQKRWLVYGWSGLMLCETGWDLKVAFSW